MSKRMERHFTLCGLLTLTLIAGCAQADGEGAAAPDGGRAAAPPAAMPADTPPDPAAEASEPPSPVEWTAGATEATHESTGVVVLQELRVARNEGFDRVVFVFDEDLLPSYEVEYVDRPVRACGSGNPVEVEGDGWLRVRFTPARAYTEAGDPTVTERDQRHQLPVVRHLRAICDFEAHLEWVIGTASPNRYRVMELREPARVVLDIRH